MTWQGVLFGFVLGFLSWPFGAVMMDVFATIQTRIALRAASKVREENRAQFKKDLELGMRAMTVDEWEQMYGPLPERKPL